MQALSGTIKRNTPSTPKRWIAPVTICSSRESVYR
jgi:hypothetical protein